MTTTRTTTMTMMIILMTMMFDAGMCCWMLDEISCSWMLLDADEGDIFALLSYRVMAPKQSGGLVSVPIISGSKEWVSPKKGYVYACNHLSLPVKGFCLCGFFEQNVLGVTFPS